MARAALDGSRMVHMSSTESAVTTTAVVPFTNTAAPDARPRDLGGLRVLVVDDEGTNRRLVQRMLVKLGCTVVSLEDGDEVEGCLLANGYLRRSAGGVRVDGRRVDGTGGDGSHASEAGPGRHSSSELLVPVPCPPPFDAILLDIMMRRTNGVDVLVDLRQRFPDEAEVRRVADEAGAGAASGGSSDGVSGSHGGAALRPLPPVVAMTGNTSLSDMVTYESAGFVHLLGKPFDNDGLRVALKACVRSSRTRSRAGDASQHAQSRSNSLARPAAPSRLAAARAAVGDSGRDGGSGGARGVDTTQGQTRAAGGT